MALQLCYRLVGVFVAVIALTHSFQPHQLPSVARSGLGLALSAVGDSPNSPNSPNSYSYSSTKTISRKPRPSKLPDLSQAKFPKPPLAGYDLIVIGAGPGGEGTVTSFAGVSVG